jgi:hypothetical protein
LRYVGSPSTAFERIGAEGQAFCAFLVRRDCSPVPSPFRTVQKLDDLLPDNDATQADASRPLAQRAFAPSTGDRPTFKWVDGWPLQLADSSREPLNFEKNLLSIERPLQQKADGREEYLLCQRGPLRIGNTRDDAQSRSFERYRPQELNQQ